MDRRFIHPLFEQHETDAAQEFLTNRMVESASMIVIDGKETPKSKIPEHIFKNMISQIVQNQYGVNAVRFANYGLVQDNYRIYYRDHILKYLNLLGIEVRETQYCLAPLVPFIMQYRAKLGYYNPISWFDPNEIWDLEYANDPRRNLVNPLNAYVNVDIELRNLKDRRLIRQLCMVFAIEDNIGIYENDFPIDIQLHMLPNSSYQHLQETVEKLHKYI